MLLNVAAPTGSGGKASSTSETAFKFAGSALGSA
ncbi:hypothetical protein EV649_5010 [Kribbella sp. VKM Ac-2569]|nr:hypothetical protein EV649_5010 [Kribbella sp. VKM Ac-2569]